jgi:hypothetical protein
MWLQPQSCVLFNLGEPMYKITIDLSAWGTENEVLTIETFDFDKIEIIKEFIEFQQAHGWAVDYDVVIEEDEDEDEDEEEAEDEEYEDEDGDYFYDAENDAWYQYDAETDEWFEVDPEEDEDESDETVGEDAGNTYIFNITQAPEEK